MLNYISIHHRSRFHLNTVALGMQWKLDANELSLADELGRSATVRAPLPCSGCIALRKGVSRPMSREGSSALSARRPPAGAFDPTSC